MRPVRSFRSIASAAVLAAAASLLVAAPANAETQNTYDPIGDATFYGDENSAGREGVEDSADIRRLRADFVNNTVRFVIKVADLTVASTDYTRVSARIATDGGADFTAFLFKEDGPMGAELRDTRTFSRVACPDLTVARSARTDTYQITVPRSCLGNPDTIRFGAKVGIADLTSGNPDCCPNGYTDDARRDGVIKNRTRLGTRTLARNQANRDVPVSRGRITYREAARRLGEATVRRPPA